MRIFVASLATETNTFAPIPTDMRSFAPTYYKPGTAPDLFGQLIRLLVVF